MIRILVMHFRSSCQFFVLVGADRLYFSTLLTFESVLDVNNKVVDNFLILLVLNFSGFRPAGVGVIDFISFLSAFACPLNRSE